MFSFKLILNDLIRSIKLIFNKITFDGESLRQILAACKASS
jgi:hypothetical protein